MENILEQSEQIKWKERGERIANTLTEMDYPNKDLMFYEVLRFFDITNLEQIKNPQILKKVETIYQYFKDSKDMIADLRELCGRLGNPIELEEKLNKVYSFVYSENLEKGIQEEKEIVDKKLAEEIAKKRAEKERLEKEKEKRERQERLRERLAEIQREKELRWAKYLKTKEEKEVQANMEKIKKNKTAKIA